MERALASLIAPHVTEAVSDTNMRIATAATVAAHQQYATGQTPSLGNLYLPVLYA